MSRVALTVLETIMRVEMSFQTNKRRFLLLLLRRSLNSKLMLKACHLRIRAFERRSRKLKYSSKATVFTSLDLRMSLGSGWPLFR